MKGSRAKGKTYERAFGRWAKREHWPELVSGQWFWYNDDTGCHYAQTDHYAVLDSKVILFECKLTQKDSAETQMELLYAPLLLYLYKRPIICCQVCKILRHTPIQEVGSAYDFDRIVPSGSLTWHWTR